ncbi:MAG: Ig-like domain-containing protein [Chloroflexi bacterium]|nr:Ig-like domain-containing protein [Chloroflexota bacterium]
MSDQPKVSSWQRFRTRLRETPLLIYGGSAALVALIIAIVIVLASGGDDSEDVVSGGTPASTTPTATASVGATPTHTPASTGPSLTVSDISYSTEGGRLGENHILVAVTVSDDGGQPVKGAFVFARLSLNGGSFATKIGTTGADGAAELKFTNAPSGCYDTVITDVTAAGLTLPWDGIYPDNGFAKGGAAC